MHATYISPLPAPREEPGFPRPLVVLGSTGSIGRSALAVIDEHPEAFRVLGLAGARNTALLAEQAARLRPAFLAVLDGAAADALKALLPAGYAPTILTGPDGYATLAVLPEAELVLSAQVGAAGLPSTLAAAKAGKTIALANKESLVLAGELIRAACHASGAVILPVDSEHNALFQAMRGHDCSELKKIMLTASGGPFRGKDRDFLATVTPEAALKHPNWSMGAKISIDSATLMNKGLEVIEAHHLYGLGPAAIEVLVHAQSIVHSLVEYHDGSILAHLGQPDMRIPIAYCLAYPRRLPLSLPSLDLAALCGLTFERPNLLAFPCLGLALDTLDPTKGGPGRGVILNAANEEAVALFLDRRIGFLDIPELVGRALDALGAPGKPRWNGTPDLSAIMALDRETRALVLEWTARKT